MAHGARSKSPPRRAAVPEGYTNRNKINLGVIRRVRPPPTAPQPDRSASLLSTAAVAVRPVPGGRCCASVLMGS